MIVGGFYKQVGADFSAIPVFFNDNLDIVGFADLDHNDMRFVISWAMTDVGDDVTVWGTVDTKYFLHMFGNLYYPKKDDVFSNKLSITTFSHYSFLYSAEAIHDAIVRAEKKQQKFWDDVHRQVAGLTFDEKHRIVTAYRHFNNRAKDAALSFGLEREVVKQVVLHLTGEYAWE